MMNKKITFLLMGCLMSGVVASTVLTPNQNQQSGQIPSGYAELEFKLGDGNWTKQIYLPNNPKNNDKIRISSSAGYTAYLDTSNIDIPLESIQINRGNTFDFIYSESLKKWRINSTPSAIVDNSSVQNIISNQQIIQRVHLKDGAWAKKIVLPSDVTNNTVMLIESDAGWDSSIDTTNLLFSSNFNLKKGDRYWFVFNQKLKKWVPEYIKPRQINVSSVGTQLNKTDSPLTEIIFGDGNWVSQFTLPSSAYDRDRVIVKSTATWEATISNQNINTSATLKINRGDRYEFMFVKELAKWILVSAPERVIQAKDLNNQKVPDPKQPVTRVKLANGNWQSVINLPDRAQINDKIIISSGAAWSSTIQASNNSRQTIQTGETLRFVYTSQGWQADSSTIDMLLVSSPAVAEKLGANAAKIRLIEGFDLTNVSAENSNAKFYLRNVGYLQYKTPGSKTLNNVLDIGRVDKVIQNERNRLKADAIYYEGDEEGCGLAYLLVNPNSNYMIGSGSINCGITVLRHEFGHNMGVDHHDTAGPARGLEHPLGSTIMGGNSISYFSSPDLFHPKYGYQLGGTNDRDAVTMINKNAKAVSLFK